MNELDGEGSEVYQGSSEWRGVNLQTWVRQRINFYAYTPRSLIERKKEILLSYTALQCGMTRLLHESRKENSIR